jgi:hypothetical protein
MYLSILKTTPCGGWFGLGCAFMAVFWIVLSAIMAGTRHRAIVD